MRHCHPLAQIVAELASPDDTPPPRYKHVRRTTHSAGVRLIANTHVPFTHVHTLVLFFFFFQAEDGIRDIGVTGVQTCALPISSTAAMSWSVPTSKVTVSA